MDNNSKKMFDILTRRVKLDFLPIAYQKFSIAKEWLLLAVANHPLSLDINSHAPSSRLGSSRGTMFGFMGFRQGSDPVKELVENLRENIQIFESKNSTVNSLAGVSILIPSKTSFPNSFSLPWSNTPWPVLLETGISGLENYININSPNSVSGEGVQSSKKIRSVDFNGEPYLTPLLAEFRKKLLLT